MDCGTNKIEYQIVSTFQNRKLDQGTLMSIKVRVSFHAFTQPETRFGMDPSRTQSAYIPQASATIRTSKFE